MTTADRFIALWDYFIQCPRRSKAETILLSNLARAIVTLPQTEWKKETGLPKEWQDGCYTCEMNRCYSSARDQTPNKQLIRQLCSHTNVFPKEVRDVLEMHIQAIIGDIDPRNIAVPPEACHLYCMKLVGMFIITHIADSAMAKTLHDLDTFLMTGLQPATSTGRIGDSNFNHEYYLRHTITDHRDDKARLATIIDYVRAIRPIESKAEVKMPEHSSTVATLPAKLTPARAAEIHAIISARNTKEKIAAAYLSHFKVAPRAKDTKKMMIDTLIADAEEVALTLA